jgi:hypothetical protein
MKTTERWTVPPADRAVIVDALHRLAAGQMDTAGRIDKFARVWNNGRSYIRDIIDARFQTGCRDARFQRRAGASIRRDAPPDDSPRRELRVAT